MNATAPHAAQFTCTALTPPRSDLSHRRLMTIRESRAYIGGIGHTRFYQLLGEGRVRAVKLGRRTMVEVASLDAYIASLSAATFKTPTK